MGYRKEVQVPRAVGPSELQAEATLWSVPEEPVGLPVGLPGDSTCHCPGLLATKLPKTAKSPLLQSPVSSCV